MYEELLIDYKQSKFNTDASHLKSANEIGKEIGDYNPVFYNALARSTQSAETLQNALQHTDQKRRFTVYEHDQSTLLVFIHSGCYNQHKMKFPQRAFKELLFSLPANKLKVSVLMLLSSDCLEPIKTFSE